MTNSNRYACTADEGSGVIYLQGRSQWRPSVWTGEPGDDRASQFHYFIDSISSLTISMMQNSFFNCCTFHDSRI